VYQRLPSWVLGFHGTDEETVQKAVTDPSFRLAIPKNDYDWLGNGIYFWENDPVRAMEFTKERMQWKGIKDKTPAVVGAVIDLGLCLNLFDQPALKELAVAYEVFASDMETLDVDLPENKGNSEDRTMRFLDCAVIEHLHRVRDEIGLPKYQTVRSGFHEGKEAYPGSGFRAKNHIQIAVRDHACIKGFFLPRAS